MQGQNHIKSECMSLCHVPVHTLFTHRPLYIDLRDVCIHWTSFQGVFVARSERFKPQGQQDLTWRQSACQTQKLDGREVSSWRLSRRFWLIWNFVLLLSTSV